MKKKYNVLVVGFGYWGPILARNFQTNLQFNVHSICDSKKINLNKAKNIYPNAKLFKSYRVAILSDDIDFVVIASPTKTHYKIAKLSLQKRKHVLCEKPLSLNLNEVVDLIQLSKKMKKFLFVDYPFIYSESVSFIKKTMNQKKLGKALIYESIREKAPYRKDTDVIWDLGIHDFAILQFLLNKNPYKFNVTTSKTNKKYKSDFANINLSYKKNFNAFIKLNWASSIKTRLIKIYFEKGLLIYDENDGFNKVRVYKKSKQGFILNVPQVNFNETLKLFVTFIAQTLLNQNFNKFEYNFSLNLTKTLLRITNNT